MSIIRVLPWNWLNREEGRAVGDVSTEHPANMRGYLAMNPWSLHREIDKLFDDAFRHTGAVAGRDPGEAVVAPRIDISGTDAEYTISADLPGIEEKDIELEVHGDVLSIKARREHEIKEEGQEPKRSYYRIERHVGVFQRMLQLPEDADVDKIGASYKNGVLSVSVARRGPQKSEARKIAISG